MCLACDCRKVCSQREPLNRILGIVRPCFAARASPRLFSSAPSLWQGQHAAFSSNIRGTSPSYNSSHWWRNSEGGKKVSSTWLVAEWLLCCTVARLGCSLHAARLFHLLRQHLFHSAKIFYANCSPAPLKLSAKSLLSPSCLASVAFFASQTP